MSLNIVDRGRQFSGYFITKAEKPAKLFGVYWENAWPCGTYINGQGVLRGVTFFTFYDDDADSMSIPHDGRHHEKLDLNLSETDALIDDPLIGALIKEIPLTQTKKNKLYDNQLIIVESDFPDGFARNRDMISRKLIQLMPEFLGKTFAKAKQNKPDIWQPTIDPISGLEVPNIWKIDMGQGTD